MNRKQIHTLGLGLLVFILCEHGIETSFAQNRSDRSKPQKLDVKNLKKRYWSEKEEYDVVQNRAFTKENRFELHAFGGFVLSDPFLKVYQVGGSLSYHFTEYLGISVLYFQYFTSPSTASDIFTESFSVGPKTNPEQSFYGGELNWNLIYGKRNLLGADILYYDMHVLFGVGSTQTAIGSHVTPTLGVGQQTYFSEHFAFRTDYRFHYYKDNLDGAPRDNFSHSVTIGISLFLF